MIGGGIMVTVTSYENRDDMMMSMMMEAADLGSTLSSDVRPSFMSLAKKVIATQMKLIDNAESKQK